MNLNTTRTRGTRRVDRAAVQLIRTPAATDTWTPVSHEELLCTVTRSLGDRGMKIAGEEHILGKDGARYWGRLRIVPVERPVIEQPGDYGFFVGVRNSLDKSMAAALGFGTSVFICSNGCFSAEYLLNRKHTNEINEDLPRLIGAVADRFTGHQATIRHRFDTYKHTEVSDRDANDIIIRAAEGGVTNYRQVPTIVKQWQTPNHHEFSVQKNAWRLFNAFTEAAKLGSEADLWDRSVQLQSLFDRHCGFNAPERELFSSSTEEEVAVLN